jgi:hypothetical protein
MGPSTCGRCLLTKTRTPVPTAIVEMPSVYAFTSQGVMVRRVHSLSIRDLAGSWLDIGFY